jgi:hypothetical protein
MGVGVSIVWILSSLMDMIQEANSQKSSNHHHHHHHFKPKNIDQKNTPYILLIKVMTFVILHFKIREFTW